MTGPTTPNPRNARRPGRMTLSVAGWALAWGLLIGPWPAPKSSFWDADFCRSTLDRLGTFPGKASPGAIRVGVAQVDLVPRTPVPLAGFVGQIGRPYAGINSRCFGKAVTVEGDGSSVTLLAADLLLIDGRLARAILDRTG